MKHIVVTVLLMAMAWNAYCQSPEDSLTVANILTGSHAKKQWRIIGQEPHLGEDCSNEKFLIFSYNKAAFKICDQKSKTFKPLQWNIWRLVRRNNYEWNLLYNRKCYLIEIDNREINKTLLSLTEQGINNSEEIYIYEE